MKPLDVVLSQHASDEPTLTLEKQARDVQVQALRAEMLRINGCLETCWCKTRASQPANLKQTVLTVGGKH
jgi:hypothetical protein